MFQLCIFRMSLNQTNIESNVENDEGDDDDEELVALKERKNQLLTEVCELREKLIAEERRHEIEYRLLNKYF